MCVFMCTVCKETTTLRSQSIDLQADKERMSSRRAKGTQAWGQYWVQINTIPPLD